MNFIRPYLFLLAAFFVGCSDFPSYDYSGDGKVEVIIGGSYTIPTSSTKTSIADDLQTAEWVPGDKIAVWAEGDSGFALSAECFEMRYYGDSYATADFWASIDPMTEGEYTYYGVYPHTSVCNNSAKTATLTLSDTQSGKFDGVNDIMVAEPLIAQQELTGSALGADALKFSHLMHILRLEIPDGRNLFGMELTGMDISFSQEVVGDITVDYTDPTAATTLSNGGSDISVVFDEPFETGDGKYIWVFMNPTTLSGEVTFVGRGADGNSAQSKVTTALNGEFAAGKITPIKFTLPKPSTVTTLQVKVPHADVKTNIGETLKSVIFTTSTDLLIEGQETSIELDATEDDIYELYFYDLTDEELLTLNSSTISTKINTTSVLKSVESDFTVSSATIGETTALGEVTVPSLFEPDLTKISATGNHSSTSNSSTTTSAAISGLSDWQAFARATWTRGSHITLRRYSTSFLWSWSYYQSRANSCKLSVWGVKDNAKVNLKVSYTSTYTPDDSDNKLSLITGIATSANGTALGSTITDSTTTTLSTANSGKNTISVELSGLGSSDRIAWKTDGEDGSKSEYDSATIESLKILIVEATE